MADQQREGSPAPKGAEKEGKGVYLQIHLSSGAGLPTGALPEGTQPCAASLHVGQHSQGHFVPGARKAALPLTASSSVLGGEYRLVGTHFPGH